ncbi:MAG: PDZ domain-containing protein, partial [Alphaproteobacteria bacterium]|nr:PDZ domain-containing protein [Alphaproteobacteria bacterium]
MLSNDSTFGGKCENSSAESRQCFKNPIRDFGNVQTGILGVNILNRNSKYAVENGLNEIDGVYVSDIEENSGAAKAGIKNGDIIKKIDNIKISKFSDLSGYLGTKRPDDIVNVTINRDGNTKVVPVTLSKFEISTVEYLDMQLKNIPKQAKEKYNIENGVLVVKNDNYALYKNLGINEGYVITEIN